MNQKQINDLVAEYRNATKALESARASFALHQTKINERVLKAAEDRARKAYKQAQSYI